MASQCVQCVWPVDVVAGYGHWDMISGQCVLKA